MKNYINTHMKTIVLALALVFVGMTTSAQTCTSTLKSRSGTVMAAGPAKITFTATSNSVRVSINKTGGKAKTTVNIYANGSFKDRIIFENGRDTPTKAKTIPGVLGKTIRVDIVNQSVGNKFKYSMQATGSTSNLAVGGKKTGRLLGNQKKTIETRSSCTNKTKVTIKRTAGKARGTVRVWKKVGSSWVEHSSNTFERSQPRNEMVLNLNGNHKFKIELKNISIGNTFSYSMDAKVRN
ncbi:hypothetical protein G5B37_06295 [Rasiella rasia]|uniref:Uncharacterized protein n=1 Tax=Rasiella rasia TaxID=2744027 RepID=A0A6G6GKV0_9FLAO|nr:hypothetical protein [Rasiella rasia]QIE59182.1 hypothetical protein G5B37_06295 [Rasiella rasia]